MFERKYRWLFEAFDKDGNCAFPSSFVKLVSSGGESEITLFLTFYEEADTAQKIYNNVRWQDVVNVSLRRVDGCGNILKTWNFNVGMKLEVLDVCGDGIIATWKIPVEIEINNE